MDKRKTFFDMVKEWTINDYRTQKIKSEVIVDMLISEFIEEIVAYGLKAPKAKLIAKEFPIARVAQTQNRQYASVDYLLEVGSAIYLVELKTTNDSIDGIQFLNMLKTCEENEEVLNNLGKHENSMSSLYGRFCDLIENYCLGSNHANDLRTKKYLYTVMQMGKRWEIPKEGRDSFGEERPGKDNLKKRQVDASRAIMRQVFKMDVPLKILYLSLHDVENKEIINAAGKLREGKVSEVIKQYSKEKIKKTKEAKEGKKTITEYEKLLDEKAEQKWLAEPIILESFVPSIVDDTAEKKKIKKKQRDKFLERLPKEKKELWEQTEQILSELLIPANQWFSEVKKNPAG